MLVDNSIYQPSFFTAGPSSSTYPEYPTELTDIFDTELFNSTFAIGGSALSASPSGSRGSSPQNLMTPPQEIMPASFPEVHDDESNNMFTLFDDDLKTMSTMTMPSSSTDFLNLSGIDSAFGGSAGGYGMDMGGFSMAMDLSSMTTDMGLLEDPMQTRGIDPQLVDTPSAVSDHGEDESDSKEESPVSPAVEKSEPEKLPTITIAPVKVGGHGKARKGTVQSGGVFKKNAASANKDKENTSFAATSSKKSSAPKAPSPAVSTSLFTTSSIAPASFFSSASSSKPESEAGDGDDDDDLPHDWRPSPEVFAKMTSKEKRQLRNKISARNFRVRRKG